MTAAPGVIFQAAMEETIRAAMVHTAAILVIPEAATRAEVTPAVAIQVEDILVEMVRMVEILATVAAILTTMIRPYDSSCFRQPE